MNALMDVGHTSRNDMFFIAFIAATSFSHVRERVVAMDFINLFMANAALHWILLDLVDLH